jgi:hypothetical protein
MRKNRDFNEKKKRMTSQNEENHLKSKSALYIAGWNAAEKRKWKEPQKEPEGNNPFYTEYRSGWEDQIASESDNDNI